MAKESILGKAQKSENLKELREKYKIKALLLGDSKSGKTTSSISLPGKKLLVDFEGRSETIAGDTETDVIRISEPDPDKPMAWNEAVDLRNEIWARIKDNSFNYDSIIWDGFSGMTRICMGFCLSLRTADGKISARGFGGGPAEHHYNPYMQEMSKFIFNAISMPVHVVFTSHFYVYEDKHTNKLEWWPKLFGNIRTEVGSWFNECFHCTNQTENRKEGNELKKVQKYYWQTASDTKLGFLGSSLNQLGKYWQSPVELNPDDKVWGFEKLLELRFGKENNA
jgi:hypothetical protein